MADEIMHPNAEDIPSISGVPGQRRNPTGIEKGTPVQNMLVLTG